MSSINVTIDNKSYSAIPNTTILQVCLNNNIEIPHFCYHDQLSIAGNCRMCLVNVVGSPKPIASCAFPVQENMVVLTQDENTKKNRENVMEMLLLNHPLDCPVCDQGGECDLQDQSLVHGNDRGRYHEKKRAVDDKNCGPLIKTTMTRCIHCTRCIRFTEELAGLEVLGTVGRGNKTEVGTYIQESIKSEVSGNLIDICPVGALTSESYAFQGRSWEAENYRGLDLFDSMLSNVRVDIRGLKILRILPWYTGSRNGDWCSDKIRFFYDSINSQRLVNPFLKKKITTWKASIVYSISTLHLVDYVTINISDFLSLYGFLKFKRLLNIYGFELFSHVNKDFKTDYTFISPIVNILKNPYNLLIFFNLNPKVELPILNLKLRQSVIKNNTLCLNVGYPYFFNFNIKNISSTSRDLLKFFEGRMPALQYLEQCSKSLILFETSLFKSYNFNFALGFFKSFFGKLIDFSTLTSHTSSIQAYESGFYTYLPIKCNSTLKKSLHLLYNVYNFINNDLFSLFIGTHGSRPATSSQIVFPVITFLEKSDVYVDIEGKMLDNVKCYEFNTSAKHENILFDTLAILKNTSFYMPRIAKGQYVSSLYINTFANNKYNSINRLYTTSWFTYYYKQTIANYYDTNIFTFWSKTMERSKRELLIKEYI